MYLVVSEIALPGPIEHVFDFVTTTRWWPAWHPATIAVSGVTDRPIRLGDVIHERAEINGRVHEGDWTVAEHEGPSRVVLHIDGGRIRIVYQFTQHAEGTQFRRELSFSPEDFSGDSVSGVRLMQAQSDEALRRLKHLFEHTWPKMLVRRVLEDALGHGKLEVIDEYFTRDATIHDPGIEMRGSAELRSGIARLRAAFPDFQFTVQDQLAEGNLVAIRYRGQGTHRGEFLNIPATGQRIDYTGIIIVRLEGARIAEFWAQPDQLRIMQQLGANVVLPNHSAADQRGAEQRRMGPGRP